MFINQPYKIRANLCYLRHLCSKKIWLLLTILFFFNIPLFSQPTIPKKAIDAYKKAELAFHLAEYDKTVNLCRQALKREPDFAKCYLLLTETYIQKNDKNSASEVLRLMMTRNIIISPHVYLLAAKLEQELGRYENMKPYLDHYEAHSDDDDYDNRQFNLLKKSWEYAVWALQNPVDFVPENLGAAINTAADEYLPCLTADGKTLIFTRRLSGNNLNTSNSEQEDFFVSHWDGKQWTEAVPMPFPINTEYNEGAGTISADGRILIFTACAGVGKEYGAGRTGYGSCDLFVSFMENEKWTIPQNMGAPINTSHWESMPSLSSDGRSLYFIRADRTKSNSGDIYVSHLQSNNQWGTPRKLPDNINSQGREHSVFIHPNGHTLYFSSNGHAGMGGFDIFVTEKINDTLWSDPKNLGYPINTHHDENSILVSADGKYAYFAANREGNYGKMDIYRFEMPQHLRPEPLITPLEPPTAASKEIFPEKIEVGTAVILHNIFFDFDKSELQPESHAELTALLNFLQKNPTVAIEIEGHTDNQGDDVHNLKLSEERAKAVITYLIDNGIAAERLAGKGYGATCPIQPNDTEEGRAANRRTEVRIK
ncbi:MAG: OmpA family protein [Bacteroidales bacterium]|nr:OmpA family protein [Bacteroidales bacterium]